MSRIRRRMALLFATVMVVTAVGAAPAAMASTDPVGCAKQAAREVANWAINGNPIMPVAC